MELVFERDELADLDAAARRLALRELFGEHVAPDEVPRLVAEVADAIDGYGPLTELVRDDSVTDVLINGARDVWVERAGRLEKTSVSFDGEHHLAAFIGRLLARAHVRADASLPIADGRLPDGSRLHVVLPPVACDGPLVSLRRWPHRLTLEDLQAAGTLDDDEAAQLRTAVRERVSVIVSGATGTGKTTLANALLAYVGNDERVVIVEETPELRPACRHFVSLTSRSRNVEGAGQVSLGDLVRAALRMRPDRIVVGEVRGAEALAALGAMSSGHEGSIMTVHARSPDEALDRLVSLSLEARSGASPQSLAAAVRRAFGLVVQLVRDGDARRISAISRIG